MKKKVSLLLALVMIMSLLSMSAFAAPDISVTVAGEPVVWTDAAPFIDANSRTLVPLRAVADAMGLEVSWNNEYRVATFTYKGTQPINGLTYTKSIQFPIGESVANTYEEYFNANGGTESIEYGSIDMDTAAVIVGGRTYAPVRYLANFFQRNVGWDNDTRTVSIGRPYVYLYRMITLNENYINFGFIPGIRYDELQSLEVVSVSIDGNPVSFRAFTASELAALDESGYYFPDSPFYAIRITAHTPETGETFDVALEIRETMKDGTVTTPTYTYTEWAEGYWGY